jgi:hypothetical protein
VTSHRPLFRWALAGQDDGALVQICTDRACRTIINWFSAKGTSGAPGAAYVYYGNRTGVSSTPLMLNGPIHAYTFSESLGL